MNGVSDPDWRDRAACAHAFRDGVTVTTRTGRTVRLHEAFFSDQASEQAEAKRVCAGCPVTDECLEYGLYEATGIFGGLGLRERQRLRRDRARESAVA